MITGNISFRNAKKHVANFKHEVDVMQRHREAMECWDCDSFLQVGIDAFEWLIRADICFKKAERDGRFNSAKAEDLDETVQSLCKGWLETANAIQVWIDLQKRRGYHLESLGRFLKCKDEIQAIVEFNEVSNSLELPDKLEAACDQAISEHKNGQTAEFFSGAESHGSVVS
ncbi:MAG TPA: hypothetical protein VFE46_11805 [Pirellulales bacterium]|jgi:hypothetical protein|nr:hypothetical protein [Pirellulales bacterium]